MMLRHAALVALLHLVPKALLDRALRRRVSFGPYVFQPQFSGRVALHKLALHLASDGRRAVALVPDYVCNIVPWAFRLAGYKVVAYSTDVMMEPDWADIARMIEKEQATVLVGASVFGSSGLLDALVDPRKLAFLRQKQVHFVADIAQDIGLRSQLPADAADVVHAVVSFNDKSFPGAMGGGVLSRARLPIWRDGSLSWRDKLALYKRLIGSNYRISRRRRKRNMAPAKGFDFSYCEIFPFRMEGSDFVPPKLQYALALAGLMLLGRIRRNKSAFLLKNVHLPTRHCGGAAYLVLDSNASCAGMARHRKKPYALDGRADVSLRPGDVVVHNKGFNDDVPV
jgi:hypothetical protein